MTIPTVTEDIQHLDFSTVLASSIHDMKNSLGMLLNSLDDFMGQSEIINHEIINEFSHLQYEGKRVNDHLIQLLALYRMDNDQYFANISEFNLTEFLDDVLLLHTGMLNYKNIELEVISPDDLYWYFDPDLVSGVITNIMNNLFKYTKNKILIEVTTEDKFLIINIKDNGPGFPEDMIFTDENQQRKICFTSGNTGLGLYFSCVVANMHKNKGRTGFTTTTNTGIDGGGCFSIYLP